MVLGAARAAAVGSGVLVGIVDDGFGELAEGGGDVLGDEEGGTVGHCVVLFCFFCCFILFILLRPCRVRTEERVVVCRATGRQ